MRPTEPPRCASRCVATALLLCVLCGPAGAQPQASTPGEHRGDRAAEAAPPWRATSDRRFDDAEYWSGVFDDPARDEWQKPAALLRALGVAPGMAVADLGAGTGYLTARLSKAVGEAGTVFAVEVEPNLVAHLRDRADEQGLDNVGPVLASASNPRLAPGSVDLVVVLDTYHHLDDRRAYLRRLARVLRPGGRIAVVEWKAGRLPVGPKEEDHKIARALVEKEMRAAGFDALPVPDLLPYQYVVVFRPVAAGDGERPGRPDAR